MPSVQRNPLFEQDKWILCWTPKRRSMINGVMTQICHPIAISQNKLEWRRERTLIGFYQNVYLFLDETVCIFVGYLRLSLITGLHKSSFLAFFLGTHSRNCQQQTDASQVPPSHRYNHRHLRKIRCYASNAEDDISRRIFLEFQPQIRGLQQEYKMHYSLSVFIVKINYKCKIQYSWLK